MDQVLLRTGKLLLQVVDYFFETLVVLDQLADCYFFLLQNRFETMFALFYCLADSFSDDSFQVGHLFLQLFKLALVVDCLLSCNQTLLCHLFKLIFQVFVLIPDLVVDLPQLAKFSDNLLLIHF